MSAIILLSHKLFRIDTGRKKMRSNTKYQDLQKRLINKNRIEGIPRYEDNEFNHDQRVPNGKQN